MGAESPAGGKRMATDAKGRARPELPPVRGGTLLGPDPPCRSDEVVIKHKAPESTGTSDEAPHTRRKPRLLFGLYMGQRCALSSQQVPGSVPSLL